ncbi:MAG: 50S ribosomal protein L23 [Patescibacteria group bacterium]|nr:50S ribosomal protein L23 [Patescibacteria group bacterium]
MAKEKEKKKHPLIIGPRITEKASLEADKGIYTFNVKPEATKNEVKKAINFIYGVDPVKVNITKITGRNILYRGKSGKKRGGKKAVVFLKEGDKIEFV